MYCEKVKAKNKQGYNWKCTGEGPRHPITNERQQRTRRGKTKKEAEEKVKEAIKELNQNLGSPVDKNITFKEFSEGWFNSYKTMKKQSTADVRIYGLSHLCRYFDKSKIAAITTEHYQRMIDDLYRKQYALSTIKIIHSTATMIFKLAERRSVVLKNPTKFIELPKSAQLTVEELENREVKMLYLEKEELSLFLQAAKEHGLYLDYELFLTMAYTGLRTGEISALKWSDINFDECTISVTKTYYLPRENKSLYKITTPKTKGSVRKIKVDPLVLEVLKKHKVQQNKMKLLEGANYRDGNFVFAKQGIRIGDPLPLTTTKNRIKRLLKIINIKKYLSPHSLRHTHTSLLAEAGVGLEEIKARLGHDDDKTTTRIYLHVTKNMEEESSKKFSSLMKEVIKI